MTTGFVFDQNQPILTFADMRLTRVFQQESARCASINEYAAATGIGIDALLDLLRESMVRQDLGVEAVGGEIFVHTAPNGRPTPPGRGQVAPNLWELLRRDHTAEEAYTLWRVYRDLEVGGWFVEADPMRIPTVQGETALLGLRVARNVIPLLILTSPAELARQSGPLTKFDIAGTGLVAVTCLHRRLDEAVTAVRQWMLGRPARAGLDVLVLEAPRYQPVLLTSDDGGITPRAVSQSVLSGDA
jgi:hypothetical protein